MNRRRFQFMLFYDSTVTGGKKKSVKIQVKTGEEETL